MNKEFEQRSKAVFEALPVLVRIDPRVVFLGGSAIQALLPKPKRLSIDLDVSCSVNQQTLLRGLEKEDYTVALRKSHNPNFLFYRLSKGGVEIKLDVSRFTVQDTEKRRLGGVQVLFPKGRYFLASKLASLSYGTIGRFEKEPSQVIKDIFDVNCLLDVGVSLDGMRRNWLQIISDQNQLRKTGFTEAECVASARDTLLHCVEAAPFPEFFIPKSALGSFQDSLVSGRVLRQDLAVMAARAFLLLFCMDDFYGVEPKVLADSQDLSELSDAEAGLVGDKLLSVQQAGALKLTAPRALAYLRALSRPAKPSFP